MKPALVAALVIACGCGGRDDAAVPGDEPACGDQVRNEGEACDGDDLGGSTCESLSLGNGVLACRSDCAGFVAASCCTPDCSGLACGPDPVCGLLCGGCGAGEQCNAGTCEQDLGCVPATCGGLGLSCGTVADGCGDELACGTCPIAPTWLDVGAGREYSCALRSDGTLWCWGRNRFGQIGDNATLFASELTPVQVGAHADWTALSVGADHACGRRASGEIWCWGLNQRGQLGDGSTATTNAAVRFGASLVTNGPYSMVAAGASHTCAIQSLGSGILWCVGANDAGQLGDGSTDDRAVPRDAVAPIVTAAVGNAHTCGLDPDGDLFCGGAGGAGQLGGGDFDNDVRIRQRDTSDWSMLDLGDGFSCGVRTNGGLACWGYGLWGQLGTGMTSDAATPEAIGESVSWRRVSAGGRHACAITLADQLFCWGAGEDGQLGRGIAIGSATPHYVGDGWSRVAAGMDHTCGIRTNGTLWCWGAGGFGRLGTGNEADKAAPAAVQAP